MKYAFLADCIKNKEIGRRTNVPVARACQLINCSISGFYYWKKADKAHRHGVAHTDRFILETIKAFITERCRGYVPGIVVCYQYLRHENISISIKRLRAIMRVNGLFHRFHRKYVSTTDSNHDLKTAPNLLERRFDEYGINEAWCGDITYLRTNEGWLFLASVIDLATRRLVGYSFGERMTLDLVTDALKKAYENELPNPGCIFHSDQGSQYCSDAFQAMLQEYNMRSSMSRRGQCWDNAPAESFWATLKREVMPLNGCFNSRSEALREVRKWLYYYNGSRPHSKLGGLSPNEFFARQLSLK